VRLLSSLCTIVCGAALLQRATPLGELKMKKPLAMSACLLVLLIAGCNVNPAPGPAGPQGQPGQQGVAGQSGDQGRDGDQGRNGDQGRVGDRGRDGQTGDQGRQGQAAPCPSGEHRYTNPNTGEAICARD